MLRQLKFILKLRDNIKDYTMKKFLVNEGVTWCISLSSAIHPEQVIYINLKIHCS